MSSIHKAVSDIRNLSNQLLALEYPLALFSNFLCETSESIAKIETDTNMPVPCTLKTLLQISGGFSVRMSTTGFALTFRDRPSHPQPFGGLVDVLDACWCWSDYRDPEDFPADRIEILNSEYVCFGLCETSDNSADHFFYDRNGKFGVVGFDQDGGDQEAWNYLFQLSSGTNTKPQLSLESLLIPYLVAAKNVTEDILSEFR